MPVSGLLVLLLRLTLVQAQSQSPPTCKTVPASPNWPSPDDWSQLNNDLQGRLLNPSPPAIVCDPSRPSTYNAAQCDLVGRQWFNETFHSADPVSVLFANWQADACLPTAVYNASTGCGVTPFPSYVVDATSASDVATAVKFASQKGVRLSIKNTGHDFLGRSTAPGLSIWTHHLRGITFLPSFTQTGCSSCQGTAAMQVFAGHNNQDVYTEARKYNVIPVVGASPGVGMGGYLTGGGHSPISVRYGLAVDNVLEMVVVTPSGDIVVANDYQNEDLFWAMRGGGGGTFGVLISATLKTYPDFPATKIVINFSSKSYEASQNNNSNWYQAMAYFHSQVPILTDNFIAGYYGINPVSNAMAFTFLGWGLNVPPAKVKKLLAPLKKKLASQPSLLSSVKITPQKSIYSDIKFNLGQDPVTGGVNKIWGSRLWDKKAVTDGQGIIKTLQSMKTPQVGGFMIAGPGVRNVSNPQSASVNPAWRQTYLHMNVNSGFAFANKAAQDSAEFINTNFQTAALRNHAPNMGCYINEADVNEPNFRQAFWGANYGRLLQIKRTYDPQGVFWCPVCVGSEDWELDPDTGELCSSPPGHP